MEDVKTDEISVTTEDIKGLKTNELSAAVKTKDLGLTTAGGPISELTPEELKEINIEVCRPAMPKQLNRNLIYDC